jgi:trk system potassium uptake protein TrkH
LAFVPPILLALADGDITATGHFVIAFAVTLAAGTVTSFHSGAPPSLHRGEAMAVVSGTWLALGIFGALPYMFEGLSFFDSFFEAVSGFTTTGATVLTDFSLYGRAFFLWRAMTQWFGGLGVIALFVVFLPHLGIAGRQLFFAESAGAPSEAVSPQVRQVASRLWLLYTILTLALIALLIAVGMPAYDSLLHALATMPAGGFSPHSLSLLGYQNAAAEWIITLFMWIAGASFPLMWVAITRKPSSVLTDGEFLFYTGAAVLGSLGVAFVLADWSFPSQDELRLGFFQAVSILTSTGFASVDYNLWQDEARVILVVMMLVGGCAGSAAGGPKCVRWVLLFKSIHRQLVMSLHRRAVVPIRYKQRVVSEGVMSGVVLLVFMYLAGYFLVGVALVLSGKDMVTAFSSAIACMGNIGPAFGEAGPMGSFAGFTDSAKLLLTIAMWVGRLEIISVLALLHPTVWRHLSFRSA